MGRLKFNNISSVTSSPITFVDANATIGTFGPLAPAFPTIAAPDYAVVEVEPNTSRYEITYLTAYTAGALTGTFARGQEQATGGGPAVAHNVVQWNHGPTVLDISTIKDVAWNRLQGSSSPLDDEFNSGSLNPAWIRYDTPGTNMPIYRVGGDVLSISHLSRDGGAGDNSGPAHCLLKPLNGLTFPLSIEVAPRLMRHYATNYQMFGPIFTDGVTTTSRAAWIDPYGYTGIATSQRIRLTTFSALNTSEILSVGEENWEVIGGPLYLKLVWSAANTFQTWMSVDGVTWNKMPQYDIVTGIGGGFTPTHAGIAISNWTTNQPCMGSIEYFRVQDATVPLLFGSSGWKWKGQAQGTLDPTFSNVGFDDSTWATSNMPFTTDLAARPSYIPTAVAGRPMTQIATTTPWDFGYRKTLGSFVPDGTVLRIHGAVDDGVSIWVNGTQILNMIARGGGATYENDFGASFTSQAPNLIAIQHRNTGGAGYLDVQIDYP